MKKIKVYLSGAMTGVDKRMSDGWRKAFISSIPEIKFFNPWDYWDFDSDVDDREAMNFDLYALRKSDLVIVNFGINPKSVGTNMELAIAHELSIPILGYYKHSDLHPWQKNMCERIFDSWDELIEYVRNYYVDIA